ncbi:methylenetetrahydrofolate reductase [Leuconostoc palmae]|uniref:methylenetetrahydrofolate reductase n=1 Tax=Leuconostoc palmae TaxID=501487 RepID=UPI001C7D5B1B|nr:methylenetetrahydrofolate reductase [Leuconostoc palmae]
MKKINKIYSNKLTPVISFEIFPPKNQVKMNELYNNIATLKQITVDLDYISITYNAGGGVNNEQTTNIAHYIQNTYNVPSLHHITAINQTPQELAKILDNLELNHIQNLLVLRGDTSVKNLNNSAYPYAKDLISAIQTDHDFTIGAAIDPENFLQESMHSCNVLSIRDKITAGTDFLISQLFFDNTKYYHMLQILNQYNIKVPISAGIMPLINEKQIYNLIHKMNFSIPEKFLVNIDHPELLKQVGIEFAYNQVCDLINHGVDGIHIYTMNDTDILTSLIPRISQFIQEKQNDNQ